MLKTTANILKGLMRKRSSIGSHFPAISWINEKIWKHQDDLSLKTKKVGNLKFSYQRPYEFLHTYQEIFQKGLYYFKSDSREPVIIDCGSNVGLSVLYFKTLFPNAKLYSFEPDQRNFEILEQNVLQNRMKDVQLNRAAVWIKDGTISFTSQGSEASRINENGASGSVASVRLRSLLDRLPEIDFLKIDIEGAEHEVIPDCGDLLHKVKNMFLEYHGKTAHTSSLVRLLSIIDENGFRAYIRNASDNLLYPFTEKETETIYDVQLNIFCFR